MNNESRPLQNPSVDDFASPPETAVNQMQHEIKPQYKQPKSQLKLDFGRNLEGIRTLLAGWKNRITRREVEISYMPYWKGIAPAFAIVSSVFLVIGSAVTGLMFFNKLQPKIPFYYNAFTESWEPVDKMIVLVLPIIFLVSSLIIIRFVYDVHKHDTRLSNTLNFVLTVVNFLFVVGIAQLYSLVVPK